MNQSLPASVPPYAGAPDSPRRAFRSLDDALVGGVASGLARHLGVPVLWMRAAFL
ncbi:MAG TPA: PspC domain-containing protein, partial [Marmoricola sp.]